MTKKIDTLEATDKSQPLIDAKLWLEESTDRFIGDHDWAHETLEGTNEQCIEWYDSLIEAGAKTVLVERETVDVNYRVGLVVEVSSAELTVLMDVLSILMTLHADEMLHDYEPRNALIIISLAW